MSKRERCLECYGVDKISLQSFQVYTKETAPQKTEDYEEQGARPKQPRSNQPKTGIHPGNKAIITSNLHRKEDNLGETTNLPMQTTSVDNRKKLKPENIQTGFKTLARKDSPKKKNKKKSKCSETGDIHRTWLQNLQRKQTTTETKVVYPSRF